LLHLNSPQHIWIDAYPTTSKQGLNDELKPIEAALQEFMAMFNCALPTEVITTLTILFNLEDNAIVEMDDALINLVADGGAKLQEDR
jgi:hypothetical protein